jgi:hypothetical protein
MTRSRLLWLILALVVLAILLAPDGVDAGKGWARNCMAMCP